MRDEEIVERITAMRQRDSVPARIGRHDVRMETMRLGAAVGELTTIFRVRDGAVTLLRADRGSFREDVAAALLDAADETPDELSGRVHVQPLTVDDLRLDRVVAYRSEMGWTGDPELDAVTTTIAPVHRSEVRPDEPTAAFEDNIGMLMRLPINTWSRPPKPRADTRQLDDWPGGRMRRSRRTAPWPAEYLFTEVAPDLGSGVRVEASDVRGHRLVVSRSWDRLTGTLTLPGTDTELPVDVPRLAAWPALAPIFAGGDVTLATLTGSGRRERDVLDVTYGTEEGGIEVPALRSLDYCIDLLDVILRELESWAVFASRSDAVVQVRCEGDKLLWLETPDAEAGSSVGKYASLDEVVQMLTVLAREDRSAVAELEDLTTVIWG
ncbi:hypothetical protein AB0M02_08605 [Actinoplanes sp. NPDC051861]|uniref:hypothetical protein n=1 Tax=Actinoplanes sp. NPDC051861 TaxID=3155170 RepID=UPI003447816B